MDEEIKAQKKQWQKPELIVLVRIKPEEAVLITCKRFDYGWSHTPNDVQKDCHGPGFCSGDCSSMTSS
jgi:hypothetical protein